MRPTWRQHAMNIAEASSRRSEDPFCKVGACVLGPRGIVLGVGYNGAPSGVNVNMGDRDARRPFMIHAEANALRYVTPMEGPEVMAVTHFPCAPCVLLAASYGIRSLLWEHEPDWDRYPREPVESLAIALGIWLDRIEATP